MDTTYLKEWKATCEIRYPPSPEFFDRRGRIIAQTRDERLTKWSMVRNRVDLHDEHKTMRAFSSYRNSGMVMEAPPNMGFFCQRARNFLRFVLEELRISTLTRIGVRIFLLLPATDFDGLVASLRDNLYALSSDQWGNLGGKAVDVGFPLTLQLGDNRANFMMGPMEREQLESHFDSATVKEKLPDVATFVDFDVYRRNPSIQDDRVGRLVHQFLEVACGEIREKTSRFLEGIGS